MSQPMPDMALRVPPHNYEAESALLGAILMNNRAYERVSEFLRPEHFADPIHGFVFETCGKLIERGDQANPVTLRTYLENAPELIAVGGMKFITTLAASAVTIINAKDYGEQVLDTYMRRELICIGEAVVNNAFDGAVDTSALDFIDEAEEHLFALRSNRTSEDRTVSAQEAVRRAKDAAGVAFRNKGQLTGVTTGLGDLDARTGGLQNSDLLILAGRPSMGKTALATVIAFNAARHFQTTEDAAQKGKFVAFFSLEMSADQLGVRLASHITRIDNQKIRKGELAPTDFEKLDRAEADIEALPLIIDDRPGLKISQMRAKCRKIKNLGLVVIDYLQLISPPAHSSEGRVQEISAMTRALKALAKDMNVPVLALSQLSRAVESREDKRPMLSDLRESGTIEQDADVVMFTFREEYYKERSEPVSDPKKWEVWKAEIAPLRGVAEIILAKQRQGPVGTVKAHFHGPTTWFSDLARDHPVYRGGE